MNELIDLDLSINTIDTMIKMNPNIINMNDSDIKEKKYLLYDIGCNYNQVRNIISSNSLYLDKVNDDIIELFDMLTKFGFKSLNILFDSNPYIFNLNSYEIDEYINNRIENGELLEFIVSDMESNPYLFNDI